MLIPFPSCWVEAKLFPYPPFPPWLGGMNYFIYVEDGGQAKVDGGRYLGTDPSLLIQLWLRISSIEGLFEGSFERIFVIKSFA